MDALRLRVLTSNVSIEPTDGELDEHVHALTASYTATEDRCELSYRIEPGELWRNEQLIRRTDPPLDVLAAFELDLYRSVVARACDGGWLVHAAAVELDGRALLLAGESGAGKSTLALALLGRGARHLTDECALVTPTGQVCGMRRPITFDPGQLDSLDLRAPKGSRQLTYPVRQSATETRRPLLLHPPGELMAQQPQPLGTIVTLRHAPDAMPGVRRLSTGEALRALWPNTLAGNSQALWATADALSRYAVLELKTQTVARACDTLCELHRAS